MSDSRASWWRIQPPRGLAEVSPVAHVVHDLRQPLTALRLTVGALELDPDTTHRPELPEMDAALARMEALLRDLEDISVVADTSDPEGGPAWFEVRAMLTEVVKAHQPRARATGVRLAATLPKEPMWAHSDRRLLTRVLANLVDNGLRHGHDRVHVTAHGDGGRLTLRVDDDGPGLPEDLEVTSQGTLRTRGGRGLGLLMCARAVEALGGHLEAARGGGGARLRVSLPGVMHEQVQAAPSERTSSAPVSDVVSSEPVVAPRGRPD
ncbi:MAG: HAMP domain-containing histidine kinase [Deltaproteobacteria bacterium]|nr:HAMP domain-containing histidine kinase [Deltaproteobacteria bacterium]